MTCRDESSQNKEKQWSGRRRGRTKQKFQLSKGDVSCASRSEVSDEGGSGAEREVLGRERRRQQRQRRTAYCLTDWDLQAGADAYGLRRARGAVPAPRALAVARQPRRRVVSSDVGRRRVVAAPAHVARGGDDEVAVAAVSVGDHRLRVLAAVRVALVFVVAPP